MAPHASYNPLSVIGIWPCGAGAFDQSIDGTEEGKTASNPWMIHKHMKGVRLPANLQQVPGQLLYHTRLCSVAALALVSSLWGQPGPSVSRGSESILVMQWLVRSNTDNDDVEE